MYLNFSININIFYKKLSQTKKFDLGQAKMNFSMWKRGSNGFANFIFM